ncbi:MAG: hypothetical protein IJO48_05080 [Clostridia bacterium]|nr:hypothetical protein [Clostridia bacterium]
MEKKWTKKDMQQTVYIKPKKYVGNKALTTYSVATTALVFLIYMFLLKPSATTLAALVQDLPLGVFLTTLICALTAFPSIKGDLKKGTAPSMPLSKAEHPIYSSYPKNMVLASLRFALAGTILFAFAPLGIVEFDLFGIHSESIDFGMTWFCIIRALYAGISTHVMMRRVIYFIICSNQDNHSHLAD